jgi:nuclear pore complex protein Nup160
MSEIQKEFQLICARLKLANKSSDLTGPGLSPAETVALLVNANLFEDAVNLAKSFDLEPRHILEGLAGKCVRLARARPTEQEAAWEWLAEYSHSGTKGPTGTSTDTTTKGI